MNASAFARVLVPALAAGLVTFPRAFPIFRAFAGADFFEGLRPFAGADFFEVFPTFAADFFAVRPMTPVLDAPA